MNSKRQAEDEHIDSPDRKRVRLLEAKQSTRQHSGLKPQTAAQSKQSEKEKNVGPMPQKNRKVKSETALEKLAQRTERKPSSGFAPPKASRTEQEKQEDAYISHLESKLGWAKSGSRTSKYGKGLEDDGLDGAFRM